MVEPNRLDSIFHALADPTRRAMLRQLSEDEHSVTQLAAPFSMSLAAASKHIQTLERAGLVQRTIVGRTHLCRLNAEALAEADGWLSFYRKFWGDRLDALENALRRDAPKKGDKQ